MLCMPASPGPYGAWEILYAQPGKNDRLRGACDAHSSKAKAAEHRTTLGASHAPRPPIVEDRSRSRSRASREILGCIMHCESRRNADVPPQQSGGKG